MTKAATVSAETTVIAHTGQGVRIQPGTYEVVDIDGATERGFVYLSGPDDGALVCADLYDPNITVKETP